MRREETQKGFNGGGPRGFFSLPAASKNEGGAGKRPGGGRFGGGPGRARPDRTTAPPPTAPRGPPERDRHREQGSRGRKTNAVAQKYRNMKRRTPRVLPSGRLFPHGCVARRCHRPCYVASSRLALRKNPSVSPQGYFLRGASCSAISEPQTISSTSLTDFGQAAVMTSRPLAVTSTSSSIRTPMFQNALGTFLQGGCSIRVPPSAPSRA